MKKSLSSMDDEKQSMTKVLTDLKLELEKIVQKEEHLSGSLHQANQIIHQREQVKKELEHLRVERSSLFSTKIDLQSQITAIQQQIDDNQREISKENIAAEQISKQKVANDDFDREGIAAKLEEKEVQLAELDKAMRSATYPEKERVSAAIEEKKKELAQLNQDIASAILEQEGKESTLKEYSRLRKEHEDAYQKSFQKMEALLVEEKETFLVTERQMEQSKQTAEDEFRSILRKAKLYKYATDYLKKVKDKEAKVAMLEAE
jgi:chromosome segregation ATPase